MADNLIADHIKGDTWDGFKFKIEDETEVNSGVYEPRNLTGCVIIAQFKKEPNGTVVFEFKTSDNTITIPTPANGEFILMPRIVDVPATTYVFDVQITYPNGVVESFDPEYWRITQDVSR
jgi:hypothetical protein